jgi:NMD protein affecting ribosome stability and mRNA decay
MDTKNNHRNSEICPRCGNWAKEPNKWLCPKCYREVGGVIDIPMIIAYGRITLYRLRKEQDRLKGCQTERIKQALETARQQVKKQIADEALACKRPSSDVENYLEVAGKEIKAKFKQLREEDEESKKIYRAIEGISWAITSLTKFLRGINQKNNKSSAVAV